MGVQTDLVIGTQSKADGSIVQARGDRQGAMVVTKGHGIFVEGTRRGTIFHLDSGAVTVAAANASAGNQGTIKFINGIFNPSNSGMNAAILNVNVSSTSGTPGGPLLYNYLTGVNLSNAATGTIRSGLIGSTSTSLMLPEVNVALLSNTPLATTAYIQLGVVGGAAAVAAGAGLYHWVDDLGGRIIVPPGCAFGITSTATGTSHLLQSTILWEEFPY